MKIIELIQRYHFKNVWPEFVKFYGSDDGGIHVTEESQELYKKVYNTLTKMKPALSKDGLIRITEIDESEFSDSFIDIYGVYPDEPDTQYAIEFMEWNEVISMAYSLGLNLKGETFSNEEFLAALIYELTFCGFEQETIRHAWHEIKVRREEIRKEIDLL